MSPKWRVPSSEQGTEDGELEENKSYWHATTRHVHKASVDAFAWLTGSWRRFFHGGCGLSNMVMICYSVYVLFWIGNGKPLTIIAIGSFRLCDILKVGALAFSSLRNMRLRTFWWSFTITQNISKESVRRFLGNGSATTLETWHSWTWRVCRFVPISTPKRLLSSK